MIKITEVAAKKIKEFLKEDSKCQDSIKISVGAYGCAGLSYNLEYFDSSKKIDTDLVIEEGGVIVVVPIKSQLYLTGTILKYSDGLNGKGFEFTNEDHKKCACGTSFRVQ